MALDEKRQWRIYLHAPVPGRNHLQAACGRYKPGTQPKWMKWNARKRERREECSRLKQSQKAKLTKNVKFRTGNDVALFHHVSLVPTLKSRMWLVRHNDTKKPGAYYLKELVCPYLSPSGLH